MSENVGIIGQKYEDRKTGKTGVLIDRDDATRMLTFTSSVGANFTVSYSAFRSNWRKSKDESVEFTHSEPESVEPEPVYTVEPDVAMTRDKFMDYVERRVSINDDGIDCDIYLYEGETEIQVMHIVRNAGCTIIHMLPDIYVFSDFKSHITDRTFAIKENMSVICNTDYKSVEEIYHVVADAIRSLNLYGYVTEEE